MSLTTLPRKKKPRRGHLIDVEYDGETGKAFLIFIDTETQETFGWFDKTGHVSYLFTDASPSKIEAAFGSHPEYVGVEDAVKYNAILNKEVTVRRVLGKTPSAIPMFRNVLADSGAKVWEAWVRYINNYCYDTGINIGMAYDVTKEEIIPVMDPVAEERKSNVLDVILSNGIEKTEILEDWIKLFEYPLPKIKITSLDIEVMPENPNILPNPKIANQPVIAIGMVTSDGRRVIYILKRPEGVMGEGYIDGEVRFFDSERDLLIETFRFIREYPFVVTFNGDNFDLAYLHNRAKRLRVPSWNNPIYRDRMTYKLRRGIHIDLYPFFKNPSIQVYAFQQKYKDFGLDPISTALLGKGKIKNEKSFEWLTYMELGLYCLNDAELTYKLLTFKNGITLNLMLSLVRMANLTIYQVTRNRISDWVRSTFYSFSRKKNQLIPSKVELASKGVAQTKAKIAGKKYEGAIVEDPRSGIFFNVVVLDYASLYPSLVKNKNIGFASINCDHKSCESNKVPFTTHHICTKIRAIEADIIGGLRDARVYYYKGKAKDKTISADARSFYDALQQAIKVYINAAYGIFGHEAFILYTPPVAESIAAFARQAMISLKVIAEEREIDFLYGDTDSVFLNNPSHEETAGLQKWATDNLGLDLGIDKVYRYALFSHRKKNYLGIFEDGRPDIKGLTGKKTQTPPVIKRTFFECIEILGKVHDMDDYDRAREELWGLVRGLYLKIKDGEWDSLEDLKFSMRLGKPVEDYDTNPQHVKAARMLQELGQPIAGGEVVEYIKATTEEGVVPLITATDDIVNIDTYIEQIQSIFIQILEPLQIDWASEIVGKTKLDTFFGGHKSLLLSHFMKAPKEPEES